LLPRRAVRALALVLRKLTFKEMPPKQKMVFVLKLAVSIVSFGFIFPNVMGD
jgi:hypothetical protein